MEARSRDGVSSNGFPQVSKVGVPIPGGAGLIGYKEDPKSAIDDMFQIEELGAGDQSAAPMNFHRP